MHEIPFKSENALKPIRIHSGMRSDALLQKSIHLAAALCGSSLIQHKVDFPAQINDGTTMH